MIWALINSSIKINTITSAYVLKLQLKNIRINVEV